MYEDLRSFLARNAFFSIKETNKHSGNVVLNDINLKALITHSSKGQFCVMLLSKVRLSPIRRYYCYVLYYVNNPSVLVFARLGRKSQVAYGGFCSALLAGSVINNGLKSRRIAYFLPINM